MFGKAAGKTFGAAGFERAGRVALQNDALLMLARDAAGYGGQQRLGVRVQGALKDLFNRSVSDDN